MVRSRRALGHLASLIALVTVAGACGDGGEGPTRTPPSSARPAPEASAAAAGAAGRRPLTGSVAEVRGDLDDLRAQGVTEVFLDLNWDPEVGSPGADPDAAVRRAEETLEALAPGGSR